MVSSGAVYGSQPPEISHIPESYPGGPKTSVPASAYGEGKRAAEALCAAYAAASPDLTCQIARCFAFVGPHLALDGTYAIGNFIGSVLASRAIKMHGDGTPLRSYLYASDLTVWLWTMLLHGPSLEPVNIGSEQPISIRELAEEVRSALESSIDVEVLGRAVPSALRAQYVPSVRKAFNELGLKQTVGLREAIRRTAEWYGWQRPDEVSV